MLYGGAWKERERGRKGSSRGRLVTVPLTWPSMRASTKWGEEASAIQSRGSIGAINAPFAEAYRCHDAVPAERISGRFRVHFGRISSRRFGAAISEQHALNKSTPKPAKVHPRVHP